MKKVDINTTTQLQKGMIIEKTMTFIVDDDNSNEMVSCLIVTPDVDDQGNPIYDSRILPREIFNTTARLLTNE